MQLVVRFFLYLDCQFTYVTIGHWGDNIGDETPALEQQGNVSSL